MNAQLQLTDWYIDPTAIPLLRLGVWTHYSIVYQMHPDLGAPHGLMLFYMNGVLLANQTVDSGFSTSGVQASIGTRAASGDPLDQMQWTNGWFDSIRVWNRPLSQADVIAEMQAHYCSDGCAVGLVSHYDGLFTSLSQMDDISGSGNHAVYRGSTRGHAWNSDARQSAYLTLSPAHILPVAAGAQSVEYTLTLSASLAIGGTGFTITPFADYWMPSGNVPVPITFTPSTLSWAQGGGDSASFHFTVPPTVTRRSVSISFVVTTANDVEPLTPATQTVNIIGMKLTL